MADEVHEWWDFYLFERLETLLGHIFKCKEMNERAGYSNLLRARIDIECGEDLLDYIKNRWQPFRFLVDKEFSRNNVPELSSNENDVLNEKKLDVNLSDADRARIYGLNPYRRVITERRFQHDDDYVIRKTFQSNILNLKKRYHISIFTGIRLMHAVSLSSVKKLLAQFGESEAIPTEFNDPDVLVALACELYMEEHIKCVDVVHEFMKLASDPDISTIHNPILAICTDILNASTEHGLFHKILGFINEGLKLLPELNSKHEKAIEYDDTVVAGNISKCIKYVQVMLLKLTKCFYFMASHKLEIYRFNDSQYTKLKQTIFEASKVIATGYSKSFEPVEWTSIMYEVLAGLQLSYTNIYTHMLARFQTLSESGYATDILPDCSYLHDDLALEVADQFPEYRNGVIGFHQIVYSIKLLFMHNQTGIFNQRRWRGRQNDREHPFRDDPNYNGNGMEHLSPELRNEIFECKYSGVRDGLSNRGISYIRLCLLPYLQSIAVKVSHPYYTHAIQSLCDFLVNFLKNVILFFEKEKYLYIPYDDDWYEEDAYDEQATGDMLDDVIYLYSGIISAFPNFLEDLKNLEVYEHFSLGTLERFHGELIEIAINQCHNNKIRVHLSLLKFYKSAIDASIYEPHLLFAQYIDDVREYLKFCIDERLQHHITKIIDNYGRTQFANIDLDSILSPDVLKEMVYTIELITSLCRCEQFVSDLDFINDAIFDNLFEVLLMPVPIDLKGVIFNFFAALCRPTLDDLLDDQAIRRSIYYSNEILSRIDANSVLEVMVDNDVYNENNAEKKVGRYPVTEGFLTLLEAVLSHPWQCPNATDNMYLENDETVVFIDKLGYIRGTAQRIRDDRVPGLTPYIEYIVNDVLNKFNKDDVIISPDNIMGQGQRWRILYRAIKVLLIILQHYGITELANIPDLSIYYNTSTTLDNKYLKDFREEKNSNGFRVKTAGFTVLSLMLGNFRLLDIILNLIRCNDVKEILLKMEEMKKLTCETAVRIYASEDIGNHRSNIDRYYYEIGQGFIGDSSCDGAFWSFKTVTAALGLVYETVLREKIYRDLITHPTKMVFREDSRQVTMTLVPTQGLSVKLLPHVNYLTTMLAFHRINFFPSCFPSIHVVIAEIIKYISSDIASTELVNEIDPFGNQSKSLLVGCINAIRPDDPDLYNLIKCIHPYGGEVISLDMLTLVPDAHVFPAKWDKNFANNLQNEYISGATAREAVLTLLSETIKSKDRVSLGHVLLGFTLHPTVFHSYLLRVARGAMILDSNVAKVMKKSDFNATETCLEQIIEFLKTTEDSMLSYPKSSELCFKILYQLCASPITSLLTLAFLRYDEENGDPNWVNFKSISQRFNVAVDDLDRIFVDNGIIHARHAYAYFLQICALELRSLTLSSIEISNQTSVVDVGLVVGPKVGNILAISRILNAIPDQNNTVISHIWELFDNQLSDYDDSKDILNNVLTMMKNAIRSIPNTCIFDDVDKILPDILLIIKNSMRNVSETFDDVDIVTCQTIDMTLLKQYLFADEAIREYYTRKASNMNQLEHASNPELLYTCIIDQAERYNKYMMHKLSGIHLCKAWSQLITVIFTVKFPIGSKQPSKMFKVGARVKALCKATELDDVTGTVININCINKLITYDILFDSGITEYNVIDVKPLSDLDISYCGGWFERLLRDPSTKDDAERELATVTQLIIIPFLRHLKIKQKHFHVLSLKELVRGLLVMIDGILQLVVDNKLNCPVITRAHHEEIITEIISMIKVTHQKHSIYREDLYLCLNAMLNIGCLQEQYRNEHIVAQFAALNDRSKCDVQFYDLLFSDCVAKSMDKVNADGTFTLRYAAISLASSIASTFLANTNGSAALTTFVDVLSAQNVGLSHLTLLINELKGANSRNESFIDDILLLLTHVGSTRYGVDVLERNGLLDILDNLAPLNIAIGPKNNVAIENNFMPVLNLLRTIAASHPTSEKILSTCAKFLSNNNLIITSIMQFTLKSMRGMQILNTVIITSCMIAACQSPTKKRRAYEINESLWDSEYGYRSDVYMTDLCNLIKMIGLDDPIVVENRNIRHQSNCWWNQIAPSTHQEKMLFKYHLQKFNDQKRQLGILFLKYASSFLRIRANMFKSNKERSIINKANNENTPKADSTLDFIVIIRLLNKILGQLYLEGLNNNGASRDLENIAENLVMVVYKVIDSSTDNDIITWKEFIKDLFSVNDRLGRLQNSDYDFINKVVSWIRDIIDNEFKASI